jgi:hypothetical protein
MINPLLLEFRLFGFYNLICNDDRHQQRRSNNSDFFSANPFSIFVGDRHIQNNTGT